MAICLYETPRHSHKPSILFSCSCNTMNIPNFPIQFALLPLPIQNNISILSTKDALLQTVKTIIISKTNPDTDTLNMNATSNPIVSLQPNRHKSHAPITNAVISYMSWSKLKYIQFMRWPKQKQISALLHSTLEAPRPVYSHTKRFTNSNIQELSQTLWRHD